MKINLPQSKYFKNVLTLLSSAVVVQLLSVLLMPVLTRVYSPEAFGFFNAFVSYSGTIALFLFFSMELAIVKSNSQKSLNRVLGLLVILGATSGSLIFISILLESKIYGLIGFDKLFDIKYFVFIGVVVAALNLVINSLITRLGIFSVYAKTQVIFVIVRFVITLILFYIGVQVQGLILGFIFASALNLTYLTYKVELFRHKPYFDLRSLRVTALRYKDLLLYNTPASLINTLIVNFPIFYIFANYSVAEAGLFGLAYRIILMPVSLMNKAIGQVLLKEFVTHKAETAYLVKLVVKNILLLALSSPIFIVIYFYGIDIFQIIFGSEWSRAGSLAALLSPYVFLSLVVSPLSFYFVAFDKNKLFSIINFSFLIILCVGSIVSNWHYLEEFVHFYTIVNSVYYVIVFFIILYGLMSNKNPGGECNA